jgi:hypothetical protein
LLQICIFLDKRSKKLYCRFMEVTDLTVRSMCFAEA